MFAKKSFSASIRRPSSCDGKNLSRVDHPETVKWSSDVEQLGAVSAARPRHSTALGSLIRVGT
jgi:hypothetical protein